MQRNIIAIGGGRIMTPRGRVPQTLAIDAAILRRAGGRAPRVLFVPTASLDDPRYCAHFRQHYGTRLGARVEELLLYRQRPSQRRIAETILGSDIIYVGGGNTLRMMKLWRRLGIDRLLDRARQQGTLLCGLSAGCICWFRQGNSDSRKFADASNLSLIKVRGLDYVDALVCPHYDVEKHRPPALKKMMQTTKGIALALENCSAIEIVDDSYRILSSMKNKHAWKVYWQDDRYVKEKLQESDGFLPLCDLLNKPRA